MWTLTQIFDRCEEQSTAFGNRLYLTSVAMGAHIPDGFRNLMREKGWNIEVGQIQALPIMTTDAAMMATTHVRDYTVTHVDGYKWGDRQWWRDTCDACGLPRETIPDFAMRASASPRREP